MNIQRPNKVMQLVLIVGFARILLVRCASGNSDQEEALSPDEIQFTEAELLDKIRGGLLGQIIGNLNGLEHEARYFYNPGNVTEYTPHLPDGAWTDDDTDFEWVYIVEMQKSNTLMLPTSRLAELWKERINKNIWCSNQYARYLMDLDIMPPFTGKLVLNPWAEFNISGQFLCESFGLMSPAMPQAAAKIGLNITSITIDYEPAQTTQFFTSMIAQAYIENDIDRILDAGIQALDPASQTKKIVEQTRAWCFQYPDDWRTTRQKIRDAYSISDSSDNLRDWNGYEINTAATVAALCYGGGDLVGTLTTAFNFGWDADNVAASAATIIGVIKGWDWIMSQGWEIKDVYKNTTRDHMPMDETITSFADRIMHLAKLNVLANGGDTLTSNGTPLVRIKLQQSAIIVNLPSMESQVIQLQEEFRESITTGIVANNDLDRAQACYLAVCFDMDSILAANHPEAWQESKRSLQGYWKVINNIFYQGDFPGKELHREKFRRAGFEKPIQENSNKEEWEGKEFFNPI